jgi:hypothetical protein
MILVSKLVEEIPGGRQAAHRDEKSSNVFPSALNARHPGGWQKGKKNVGY